MNTAHTIAALCQRSRDISLEKGWLNPDGTDPRPFHTVIALFHTELSEAFEDIRSHKGLNEVYYEVQCTRLGSGISWIATTNRKGLEDLRQDPNEEVIGVPKPCGIPMELADFVIRVCQWAGSTQQANRLHELFESLELQVREEVLDDAEAFIAELHANVSLSYLARFIAVGNKVSLILGFPDDRLTEPLYYLATSLLLVSSFCRKHDINIWAAIDEKEAYNRTRSHKHGGKKV